jgi:hypothetical protein
MTFKLSPIDKNNLYHDIRLRIKEFNVNEATQSILILFEKYINENIVNNDENDEDDENNKIEKNPFKQSGSFRRVSS